MKPHTFYFPKPTRRELRPIRGLPKRMKTTVIYHSADYDGIFCREIAKKFIPDAELIGWNFGDIPVNIPNIGKVYIMDLPVDRVLGFDFNKPETIYKKLDGANAIKEFNDRLTWIDHHKTSIETHPNDIPGYRIDGVAACRLAWQWFSLAEKSWKEGDGANPPNPNKGFYALPEKEDFINRAVSEPLAVRLAGEYDIWDKRDPRADILQYALCCVDPVEWDRLFSDDKRYFEILIEGGEWAQHYAQRIDADLVEHKSYRIKWEGLDFLVLNTGRFNSLTFTELDVPETGHDALMGYMFNGKVWTVSLYHAKHRTDIDLSEIAKKYGGGGHKGACGFTCQSLPFHS